MIRNLKLEEQSHKASLQQSNSNSSNNQTKSTIAKGFSFFSKEKNKNYNDNVDEDQLYKFFTSNEDNTKYNEGSLIPMYKECSIQTNLSELFSEKSIDKKNISFHKKIILKEIEGNQLKNRGILQINAGGLVDGARGRKDGVALFGWSIKNSLGQIVNDYAFDSKIENSNQDTSLFLIYFNQKEEQYFIRCYYESLNSFVTNYAVSPFMVRVDKRYTIQSVEFIMIGDLFFIITVDAFKGQLKIKKNKTKKNPTMIEETFSINNKRPITIGRDNNCTIPFQEDKSFSKVHCSIYYSNKDQVWYLQDGIENKPSTNGIWVVPKKSFQIYDGMWFKVLGCTKCQVNFC